MFQELSVVVAVALLPFALAAPAAKEKTYDYIVVGGGLTGLVVANRLSENRARSVLVLENGVLGDPNNANVAVPGLATNPLYLPYMYNFTHAPDAGIGGATALVTIGNVVGGGSVVNGMAFDRASAADYDAWKALGNKGWGWSDLLPYFQKSTTFTPPASAHAKEFNITYDASYYGNGPIQASYPVFEYPDMKTIWKSYKAADVPLPKEHASGDAVGAFWIPTALRPKTQDRSHARNGYYDPVKTRKNLNLQAGQHVDQILFDGLTAKGVQFTSRADGTITKAFAKREVILAAGAVFTPQLLQLSGIGPKAVLKAAGIKVKKDFAAVGQNLQDHPNANMFFGLSNQSFPNPLSLSDPSYNATAWSQYWSNRTGPYTQAHGSSLFFPSLQTITKDYKAIVKSIKSQKAQDFLPAIFSNAKLRRGYEAQRAIIADLLLSEKAAVGEIPMSAFGLVISALQRPLSRGSVTLDPANPTGNPVVQFNTFQNPADKKILLEMMRWSRAHYASKELAEFAPFELTPGAAAQTDEEIVDAMIQQDAFAASFAHMSSTAAMMPENYGGVVSDQLLVYGTKRLSVVDASIIPLVPAAHLQATMYAIAEKAADLIKARNR